MKIENRFDHETNGRKCLPPTLLAPLLLLFNNFLSSSNNKLQLFFIVFLAFFLCVHEKQPKTVSFARSLSLSSLPRCFNNSLVKYKALELEKKSSMALKKNFLPRHYAIENCIISFSCCFCSRTRVKGARGRVRERVRKLEKQAQLQSG